MQHVLRVLRAQSDIQQDIIRKATLMSVRNQAQVDACVVFALIRRFVGMAVRAIAMRGGTRRRPPYAARCGDVSFLDVIWVVKEECGRKKDW